jgi:primase-polymerase (primpol)-like protein
LLARQIKVFEAFDSYSEISFSGNGLHIIVEGEIPSGRRRGCIEMYDNARFFTVTGNSFPFGQPPKSLRADQELLSILWGELGSERKDAENHDSIDNSPTPEISDDAVREFIRGSDTNRRYFEGEASDWSSAYFALICAVSLTTSDKVQERRVVLTSPLVLNTPPKGRETRLHKAERLWATEYARAAARGAQERHTNDRM